eukprot:21223-Heterococcus_DN1.PRE.2
MAMRRQVLSAASTSRDRSSMYVLDSKLTATAVTTATLAVHHTAVSPDCSKTKWDVDKPNESFCWDVHVDAVAKPTVKARDYPDLNDPDQVYFIYVCIKGEYTRCTHCLEVLYSSAHSSNTECTHSRLSLLLLLCAAAAFCSYVY